MSQLTPISARRRRTDVAMRGLMAVGTLLALVPLGLILFYLMRRGLGAWSWHFFTSDPTGRFIGDPGGIKSALIGTILIVALAALIAIPIGIGVAVYLVEYGGQSKFANIVRYFVDVMTGVPSIVFGLFIYIVLILSGSLRRLRRVEGVGGAGPPDASRGHPIGRSRAEPRAERLEGSRSRAWVPAVAAHLPRHPADRPPRSRHRLAARGGTRGR